MKKGREKKSFRDDDGKTYHFRLCHICWKLGQSESTIYQCGSCGKHFFDAFEDEESDPNREKLESSMESDEIMFEVPRRRAFLGGVTGLSVIW